MKTYKGRVEVVRRDMLQVNHPFKIEAVGWPEAIVEVFRRFGTKHQIMKFTITDESLQSARKKWLKEEYQK